MITIAELFPLHRTCCKWLCVFREITNAEKMRLEKDYIMHLEDYGIEWWTVDEVRHRTNDPAYIEYYETGTTSYQSWVIRGNYHKTDGPARIGYDIDGNVQFQEWWVYGVRHRTDGPAYITYHENGNVEFEEFWVDGCMTTRINK